MEVVGEDILPGRVWCYSSIRHLSRSETIAVDISFARDTEHMAMVEIIIIVDLLCDSTSALPIGAGPYIRSALSEAVER